jgi:signal transduction histidine kinase
MLAFAFGSIALILGWLGIWVVRPVRSIDQALRTHSAAPIETLSKSSSEFGEIARLIIDFFAQATDLRAETRHRQETESALRESEETLRQMLKDRTRLGLDLHDSTIQTLYASGMSLVAVENRNPQLPEESKQSIRDVRRNLQETIDELRRFIGQAETTILANSVSESIQLMITFLRNTSQVHIESEIEEIPNDRLDPKQGMHLLQVVRESVTNALRHAQAQVISVQVQVRPGLVRLRVEDDGIGLPQHTPEAPSHGMLNMHQRAELADAELEIKSRPGGGTRIDLSFHTD